jgi:hypothetical protein
VLAGSTVNSNSSTAMVDRITGDFGGIFSLLGGVTIDHSSIDNNVAPYGDGGGIYNVFNQPRLDHATIAGNITAGDGGGIWNRGVLTSNASMIAYNSAAHDGGGHFNARGGLAVFVDSAFTGNQAGH